MPIGGVVTHRCGSVDDVRAENGVAFGGMQIAARRIHAQSPARRTGLFPRAQTEAVAEKHRHGLEPAIDPGLGRRPEQLVVPQSQPDWQPASGIGAAGGVKRLNEINVGRAIEASERIGLRGPVQVAGRSRESVDVVLGLVVVPGNQSGSGVGHDSSARRQVRR